MEEKKLLHFSRFVQESFNGHLVEFSLNLKWKNGKMEKFQSFGTSQREEEEGLGGRRH